jgi:hypothetical protein
VEARPKGIRLRTLFKSEDEFVVAFQKLCDEQSVFVPTSKLYPTNTSCYFSLELADEAPMLRGLGTVIDAWSTNENPFKRAGMHVRVTQLTTQTEPIFERVLAARPAALRKNGPRTRNAPMTQQQWGSVVAPQTEQMDATDSTEAEAEPFPSDPDAEETANARPVTRELRSPSIPPPTTAPTRPKPVTNSAAPIAEMDEKTTETLPYDSHLLLPAFNKKPAPRPTPPPAAETAEPKRPTPAPIRPTPAPGLPPISIPVTPPPLPAPPAAAAAPAAPAPAAVEPAPSSSHAFGEMLDYPTRTATAGDFKEEESGVRRSLWQRVRGKLLVWRASFVAWWRNGEWRDGGWRKSWWANRRTAGVLAVGILVGVLFTVLLRPSRSAEPPPVAAKAAVHEPVACTPAPAAEDASKVEVAAAAAPVTKPGAKPAAGKPTTTPTKVATAAPKPAAATKPAPAPAAKPAAPAPKPPVAVAAATKPTPPATRPTPTPPATKPTATVAAAKPAAPATKPATPATTKPANKPTNVATAKPASKGNPCNAPVPCI